MVKLPLFYRLWEGGVFLLFLSLPTYLIRFKIGPLSSTIMEILVLWVIGVGAILFFQKGAVLARIREQVKENKLLFSGVFLFLLGTTISIFTAVDIQKALGEWRAFYVEPVLLFLVLASSPPIRGSWRGSILFPLILSGLATSILAIYQHFTGWLVPYAFWENRATYRVTAWYGFPNAVGLFLAPLIPLTIYLIKNTKYKHQNTSTKIQINLNYQTSNRQISTSSIEPLADKLEYWNLLFEDYLFLGACILFLLSVPFALLFAKGSGPIIGTLAGAGLLLLWNKKTRWPAIAIGLLSLSSILGLSGLSPIKQELLFQDRSAQLRLDMWKETKEFLRDHPIRGAGLASYEERIVPYRQDRRIEVFHHPHNLFLTIWVNTGLVGLVGFIFIVIWCLWQIRKNKTQEIKFFLSSLVVILVMGLVDSPYIKNDLAILFWLLPALLLMNRPIGLPPSP